jgi:hypothetical protein
MTSLLPRWAERMLGPVPTLKEINLVCWGLFLAFLVLPLCVVVRGRMQTGQPLWSLDVDFVYFYSMGRILNEYPAEELYNYDLQKKICTEVRPLRTGTYGPIPYPPFIGILFQPFARMSFSGAYLLWLSISLMLYIAGLAMFSARFFSHDPLRRSLVFCFALSFCPFISETIISGHLSTIGFFALALAFHEEDLGRPILSGLALSVCLYKPTLLVLFLPMQLVTRRLKALVGFAAGSTTLLLFATAVAGPRVWSGYKDLLLSFGLGSAAVHSRSFKQLWKYVDFTSFSSLIPGGRSWLGLVVLFACVCWAVFSLFRVWQRSAGAKGPVNTLMWATTLTWTLLLNLYVPIYDCILVVLSITATAGVLKDLPNALLYRPLTVLWLLIFAFSWITVDIAEATGFQTITVLLAALGMLQFAAFRNVTVPQPEQVARAGAFGGQLRGEAS